MSDVNQLLHKELTGRILAAAMEVHREVKNGLDEKIYENSLNSQIPVIRVIPGFKPSPRRTLPVT